MARLAMKAQLMDAARRSGWRGRSYRKAKRFAQQLRRDGLLTPKLRELLSRLTVPTSVRRGWKVRKR